METVESIKRKIRRLYETNPTVHMDVSITHPRVRLQNVEVVIKDIYAHIFRVEEVGSAPPRRYALQYTDVLTKQIRIAELEEGEAAPEAD